MISPSGRSAAHYAAPLELGLHRLRDELGLEPVEYPTTRATVASAQERAADIGAAFADPAVRALIATIGGEDEIRVLRHLDRDVIAANPKPFFGYSDNTNLHLYLRNLGIVSYHGGAVMVQLGRPGAVNPLTLESLRKAMFERGTFALRPAAEFGDEDGDWEDPRALRQVPRMFDSAGWTWHGPASRATGPGWGGSLEVIDWHLRANRYILDVAAYRGAILFLETSEEMPDETYVYRVLMGMGERGLLEQFAGALWARPKAWSFERRNSAAEKERYIDGQRSAVVRAFEEYNSSVPLVFGVEFGHTDPQYVLPSGGRMTIDPAERSVTVEY